METASKTALIFAQTNAPRFVEELKALLRIPSISTLPRAQAAIAAAPRSLLAAELRRIGMENVRLIETTTAAHPGGHPLVYADWLHAHAGKPTALCLWALRCAAAGSAG